MVWLLLSSKSARHGSGVTLHRLHHTLPTRKQLLNILVQSHKKGQIIRRIHYRGSRKRSLPSACTTTFVVGAGDEGNIRLDTAQASGTAWRKRLFWGPQDDSLDGVGKAKAYCVYSWDATMPSIAPSVCEAVKAPFPSVCSFTRC